MGFCEYIRYTQGHKIKKTCWSTTGVFEGENHDENSRSCAVPNAVRASRDG